MALISNNQIADDLTAIVRYTNAKVVHLHARVSRMSILRSIVIQGCPA
jgi:hypothetical protein